MPPGTNRMKNLAPPTSMSRIALFTLALGNSYHDFLRISLPFNQRFFFPDMETDFHYFSDLDLELRGAFFHPARKTVWPFTAFNKMLFIDRFLKKHDLYRYYDYVYFIDADMCFARQAGRELLASALFLINVPWRAHVAGGFFGGEPALMWRAAAFTEAYVREGCDRKHFDRTADEFVLKRVYDSLETKTELDCEGKKQSRYLFFSPRVEPDRLEEAGEAGHLLVNVELPGRAYKDSIFECIHPRWRDTVELDLERGWINHRGHLGELAPAGGGIGTASEGEEVFRIHWWDFPGAEEYLHLGTGRITVGQPSRNNRSPDR